MKPIKRPVHAAFDYIYGIGGLLMPKLLGFENEKSAALLVRGVGAFALATALFSRHEGGIVKLVPFNLHLKADAASAVGILAAPWLLGFASNARVRNIIVALAVSEMILVALTEPDSSQTQADEQAKADIEASKSL